MKVIVVGAGIGGLCLAQGLRQAGIDVYVYERAAAVAVTGYRIRINEQGLTALRRCLPAEMIALLHASGNHPRPLRTVIFNHQLTALSATDERPADAAHASLVTNNLTLREVLLTGLADSAGDDRPVVAFEHTVVAARDCGHRGVVTLANGDVEEADLVVGADGVDSTLRPLVAPEAELVDVGVVGISGQAILDADLRDRLPDALYGGASPVIAPDGLTLAVGVYQPATPPPRAAAALAPQVRLSPVPDHVKWTLVGPPGSFRSTPDHLAAEPAAQLRAIALRTVASWSPVLAELIGRTEDTTISLVPIRATLTVPPWSAGRVTLLGDAIHTTTAVGGDGAGLALRDAALLTDALAAVARDGQDLRTAVAGYEHQMREYGTAAARRSLHKAERLFRVGIPALA